MGKGFGDRDGREDHGQAAAEKDSTLDGLDKVEDVAVAGFDDSAAATMAEPPLTTMRNPLEESAVEAVSILDALMTGRSGPRQVVLPTALVPRQSA